jgi:hypothetical protein
LERFLDIKKMFTKLVLHDSQTNGCEISLGKIDCILQHIIMNIINSEK